MVQVEASEPTGPSTPLDLPAPSNRGWRLDAWILASVAVVIRLPALFATRSLVFDDGVFGSSALSMRAGNLPFRDIFSSQGPVFLPLVWLADLAGFRMNAAPNTIVPTIAPI